MKRLLVWKIITIFFIFLILVVGCSNKTKSPIDKPVTSTNSDGWNQPNEDSPSNQVNTLYNLTEVPKLDKLFINTIFVKQMMMNKFPYLYGYSSDGKYVAFIKYVDKENDQGFLLQIYNYMLGDLTYSIFIPNTGKILETKDFALAKQATEKGFNINVPPSKLHWDNNIQYETNGVTWSFSKEKDEIGRSYLKITNSKSLSKWKILSNNMLDLEGIPMDVFSFPGKPEWLTFVFNQDIFKEKNGLGYTPIFIQLDRLTKSNSENGKTQEADLWLYNTFRFVYNQWDSGSDKGFIAIADLHQQDNGLDTQSYDVDQWVYLDDTGKMEFYGNPKGIFNSDVNPIQPPDHIYYYHIHLFYGPYRESLQYFVVDQFDDKTQQLIRTYEFNYDQNDRRFTYVKRSSQYSMTGMNSMLSSSHETMKKSDNGE